jgi:putative aminopeptidase FrvX
MTGAAVRGAVRRARQSLCPLLAASALTAAPVAAQEIDIAEAERTLEALVESYGASGMEGPVREQVKRMLPDWAASETDTAGNLWVRVGRGDPVVVFVAHLDEIGFRVSAVREDGTLELERLGGFFPSVFEGRPALVHTGSAVVPGIILPRDSLGAAPVRTPPALRADIGAGSPAAVRARGVEVGSTVTMPKEYARLAGTRATGRSFDDRVGSTALVLALRHLDRSKLRHQVIFLWSVREEVGLEGAEAAARTLGTTAARVHAVDTFVSADAPFEIQAFGNAPLGAGAVIRAVDNSAVAPRPLVDSLLALAAARRIPIQLGGTNGGNDGSAFAPWGVPDVAIAWPLRYSHSPAEVADLADVTALARLVRAIAEEW